MRTHDRLADEQRIIEDVETLVGERSRRVKDQAAIRIVNLQPLLQMSEKLQSAPAVGATPTKAEYDALQADIKTVHDALVSIAGILKGRLD